MKSFCLVALALVGIPVLVPAQHRKKPTTPAIFANARYVYVETLDGDAYTPGLYPGDRQAIADVQDALRDWGRYMLTTDRSMAELVFIVRKGRVASARVGGSTGPGGNSGPMGSPFPGQGRTGSGPSTSIDTETGPADDLLDIHLMGTDGKLGAAVWTRTMTDGLEPPRVALIRMLRTAVEKDYPR